MILSVELDPLTIWNIFYYFFGNFLQGDTDEKVDLGNKERPNTHITRNINFQQYDKGDLNFIYIYSDWAVFANFDCSFKALGSNARFVCFCLALKAFPYIGGISYWHKGGKNLSPPLQSGNFNADPYTKKPIVSSFA